MILQEGFIAVNFDLWILLVKYEIPSIFISSKPISETRFNRTEFVCYTNDKDPDLSIRQTESQKFVIIITPAMYIRDKHKTPEYKLIMDENNKIGISLENLIDGDCLKNIEHSINIYHSIEEYIAVIFEKDNTTKYKKRVKGVRNIEFVIKGESINENVDADVADVGAEKEDKPVKKIIQIEKKKGKNKIILEEAEEVNEPVVVEEFEQFDFEPAKKKTKKRKPSVKVNPHGKTKKNIVSKIVSNI
jgi:hypothetical protein